LLVSFWYVLVVPRPAETLGTVPSVEESTVAVSAPTVSTPTVSTVEVSTPMASTIDVSSNVTSPETVSTDNTESVQASSCEVQPATLSAATSEDFSFSSQDIRYRPGYEEDWQRWKVDYDKREAEFLAKKAAKEKREAKAKVDRQAKIKADRERRALAERAAERRAEERRLEERQWEERRALEDQARREDARFWRRAPPHPSLVTPPPQRLPQAQPGNLGAIPRTPLRGNGRPTVSSSPAATPRRVAAQVQSTPSRAPPAVCREVSVPRTSPPRLSRGFPPVDYRGTPESQMSLSPVTSSRPYGRPWPSPPEARASALRTRSWPEDPPSYQDVMEETRRNATALVPVQTKTFVDASTMANHYRPRLEDLSRSDLRHLLVLQEQVLASSLSKTVRRRMAHLRAELVRLEPILEGCRAREALRVLLWDLALVMSLDPSFCHCLRLMIHSRIGDA
jgi:hypothetical protein